MSYDGRRITADEVEAAYRETGLEPATGNYVWPSTRRVECACGIGVLICQKLGVRKGGAVDQPGRISKFLGIKALYRRGYTIGFDGAVLDDDPRDSRPETIAGFEDGRLGRMRVLGR